jgi:hypothetical protein
MKLLRPAKLNSQSAFATAKLRIEASRSTRSRTDALR